MIGLGDLTKQLEELNKISKQMTKATKDLNDRIETLTNITEALVEELKINSESRKMVAKVCKYDQKKK